MEVTAGYNNDGMVEVDHVRIIIGERIYIIRPSPEGGDGMEDGSILVSSVGIVLVGYTSDGVRLTEGIETRRDAIAARRALDPLPASLSPVHRKQDAESNIV